jgi:hypothetical protein
MVDKETIVQRMVLRASFPKEWVDSMAEYAKEHSYLGIKVYPRGGDEKSYKMEFQLRNVGRYEGRVKLLHFAINWAMSFNPTQSV